MQKPTLERVHTFFIIQSSTKHVLLSQLIKPKIFQGFFFLLSFLLSFSFSLFLFLFLSFTNFNHFLSDIQEVFGPRFSDAVYFFLTQGLISPQVIFLFFFFLNFTERDVRLDRQKRDYRSHPT